MANPGSAQLADRAATSSNSRHYELIVILVAAVIYLGCCISPPSLMDDVDAVQAQIARNMLESGDWVTARLNGIAYLEKSPLIYWMMGASYALFGVRDWAARLPLAVSVVLLCWLTARFGAWAFGQRTGLYAGLVISTSLGLWLFTRIQIPDAILTLTITFAMWSFLRVLDSEEQYPMRWAYAMSASIGVGLLLKGLIAALFPIGAIAVYLLFTGQLFSVEVWRRFHPVTGVLIILGIAAPWHIAATVANPPILDFTMKSEPGRYHGFFWFYFFNEHVFRFLNMRHPRDYNTVPRVLFWLFHLLWLLPWSAFLPAIARLGYKPIDRAGRTKLLALCWTGFLLCFFTLSTTQEYYSMPCYPALALLIAVAMTQQAQAVRIGAKVVTIVAATAAVTIAYILVSVRNLPTPGDISTALTTQDPQAYTLSLGHMGDLTLQSFAYLQTPLLLAGAAFVIGAAGAWRFHPTRTYFSLAAMMLLFLHAARLALVAFDPYLASRPLAEALLRAPAGQLIADNQYYTFSSVFFYTNRQALLLNGRVNNLEYGSYAPGAPDVFIDDVKFKTIWQHPARAYLMIEAPSVARAEEAIAPARLHQVAASGGKFLFTNHEHLR